MDIMNLWNKGNDRISNERIIYRSGRNKEYEFWRNIEEDWGRGDK